MGGSLSYITNIFKIICQLLVVLNGAIRNNEGVFSGLAFLKVRGTESLQGFLPW